MSNTDAIYIHVQQCKRSAKLYRLSVVKNRVLLQNLSLELYVNSFVILSSKMYKFRMLSINTVYRNYTVSAN